MKWITRCRPKIDRIACPWLIARYIDHSPEFLFVDGPRVLAEAKAQDAIPFDVPGVELSHVGDRCSFDAFIAKYGIGDPMVHELSAIVRAADTGRLDLSPQAAGLLAVSLGLSQVYPDDHVLLRQGFVIYDALYAWLRDARHETHGWPPAGWLKSASPLP
jgi:hypothetical protein